MSRNSILLTFGQILPTNVSTDIIDDGLRESYMTSEVNCLIDWFTLLDEK